MCIHVYACMLDYIYFFHGDNKKVVKKDLFYTSDFTINLVVQLIWF